MATSCFTFCGVPIEVSASRPFSTKGESGLFQTPAAKPAMRVRLEEQDALKAPPALFCGTAGEKQVWRQDRLVWRRTKDFFRSAPHMEVQYRLDDLTNACARVRGEDWIWATGPQYLWPGLALNQLLLHYRTLIFHASYIVWNGKGILFTAPSETGKSTQAELWHRHRGAEIINGDKAGVSLRGCPTAHGVPFSGTSGICRNISAPLAAVAVLSQAPDNSIRPMAPSEAVTALFGNVFVDRLIQEEWTMALTLMLDLVEAVPVYALACTPDLRAVEALERSLI